MLDDKDEFGGPPSAAEYMAVRRGYIKAMFEGNLDIFGLGGLQEGVRHSEEIC
jgi:hypothetical protein